uniref:Uncharacterized protein n=1 Tax=Rhizophora mucronata TaxID=61149 RepID=A0A2P2N0A6_RHIMU
MASIDDSGAPTILACSCASFSTDGTSGPFVSSFTTDSETCWLLIAPATGSGQLFVRETVTEYLSSSAYFLNIIFETSTTGVS